MTSCKKRRTGTSTQGPGGTDRKQGVSSASTNRSSSTRQRRQQRPKLLLPMSRRHQLLLTSALLLAQGHQMACQSQPNDNGCASRCHQRQHRSKHAKQTAQKDTCKCEEAIITAKHKAANKHGNEPRQNKPKAVTHVTKQPHVVDNINMMDHNPESEAEPVAKRRRKPKATAE